MSIEHGVVSMGGIAGHGKLSADKKAVFIRSGSSKQISMEPVEFEFAAFRILAPGNKQSAAARVVGVRKEPEPMKSADHEAAGGDGSELAVKVRGVVEWVALHKDGDVRKCVVARGEVMRVGVGFPSDIREGNAAGCAVTFVINRDAERTRHAPQPSEVFAVPCDDEFKRRFHDSAEDAAAELAAQTIWGMLIPG